MLRRFWLILCAFCAFLWLYLYSNPHDDVVRLESDFLHRGVFVIREPISRRTRHRRRVAGALEIEDRVVLRRLDSFHRTRVDAQHRRARHELAERDENLMLLPDVERAV